jgi:hypothetical protein
MKLASAVTASLVALATPVLAQDTGNSNTLPESLRIQQNVTQQNANDPNMPANRNRNSQTSTEAPGNATGPVERKRLDPSAPSPQRLQIEGGANRAARQNPEADTLHPGPSGNSYNTIVRGAPSNSGAIPGTPGAGPSGTVGGTAGGTSSTGAGSGTSGSAGGASSGGSSGGGGGGGGGS